MTKEEQQKTAAEAIWLNYFNGVLHREGIISDRSWSQMSRRINFHPPVSGRR